MSQSSWTHAICEACWIHRQGVSVDGEMIIRQPTIVRDPDSGIEACCFCGKPTVVGIFVRHNPNEVQYCQHK